MNNLRQFPTENEILEITAMTNAEREDLTASIKAASPFAIFEPVQGKEGKEIVCPFCGSGSGKKGTGIKPTLEGTVWLFHCFANGDCEGTLIDLIAKANNLSTKGADFFQILAIGAKITGQIFSSNASEKPAVLKSKKKASPELQSLIVKDIENGKAHLELLTDKERRGLTNETLADFQIGVILKWSPPQNRLEGKKSYPTPRVIIPHLTQSALPEFGLTYCAGLLQSERDLLDAQGKKYIKYLYSGVNRTPFGLNTLKPAEKIFVTEGEFDALSIWQATGGQFPCLATGGTALNGLLNALKKFYNEKSPVIYLSADNDAAGRKFATDFCAKAKIAGIIAVPFYLAPIDCPKLDANKILVEKGTEKLSETISAAVEGIKPEIDKVAAEIAELRLLDAQLSFITDENARADFIKLKNLSPSKDRNAAMIQIIRKHLESKSDAQGKKLIKPTAANFRKIFNTDPVLANLYAVEDFQGATVFLRQPQWRKTPCVHQTWTDFDDSAMRNYLRENYTPRFSDLVVSDMFTEIANSKAFNVATRFLESLPPWDKKPRAETLFIDFLNVADSEYARQVSSTWLLAAMARIYYPGCKFQNALVVQGQQGIGKSYLLEQLGGDFYGSLTSDVDDIHAIDEIRNIWICEIKEMSAMRKADVNAQKAFIERNFDNYRPAYAKRAQKFQRHCVFAITVNDTEFLRDTTGNRRYWILNSNSKIFEIPQELTPDYIRQVWAEMLFKFKALTKNGFSPSILELPLKLKLQAEKIATCHVVNDGLLGEIGAFLDIKIPCAAVWNCLTREEKREFFIHEKIIIDGEEIAARATDLSENAQKEIEAICLGCANNPHIVRLKDKDDGTKCKITFIIHGERLRQETCAAEIYNEFSTFRDRRITVNKIAEILPRLEGWQLQSGRRIKDFNGYGDQKKIYSRIDDCEPAAVDNQTDFDLPF